MLAFMGRLVSVDDKVMSVALEKFSSPLMWFAWGVAMSALGIGMAYFANYCVATSSAMKSLQYEHPYVKETISSVSWWRAAIVFQILAIVSGLSAWVLFLVGVYAVKAAVVGVS